MNHFGRTGAKKRPRIRKFHAELLLNKFNYEEKVINKGEINRPDSYIKRMVKFSKGWLEFINVEALEIQITDEFFGRISVWKKQYTNVTELDHSDDNLAEQGILMKDDGLTFDGRLIYSRFYKIISDEGESMNDPRTWEFNDKNIDNVDQLNFSDKDSAAFSSKLYLMKFYVLRKVDEVSFVTSRFVYCPTCNANYVVPASKIDFQTRYTCENRVGDKICKTALKRFPARKMIPTYIYEVSIEVVNKNSVEFKEFFLESFVELHPGFFTGMVFGRTEPKTNSFYFTCLTAREEKGKFEFNYLEQEDSSHQFFNIIHSVQEHIKKVGFLIDTEKAKLPFMVETIKKLNLIFNKEINLDHSLYFGAPGIGKTYALTLLHHMFFSNSGFISGPRFSLPGLTGGQKEIYYQDMAKKKNVPGLFSCQAFVFDEINNAQFLADDKAINLTKSVALAPSGTSSTVGGKEFPRIALMAGTANYDVNHLKHYENKVKSIYSKESKSSDDGRIEEQSTFLDQLTRSEKEISIHFDFYAPLKEYGQEVNPALKVAVLKVRDEPKNYLTNFPNPLMERFYWTVLVHPKYDKAYLKSKNIDVLSHLKSRKNIYSQRELISQLFVPEFDGIILEKAKETIKEFEDKDVEKIWSSQVKEFLMNMANKYPNFFAMFSRIPQVHVFTLYTLSVINNETILSFETRKIFEKLISLLHVPIRLEDFHNPDFENFRYLGETKGELIDLIKRNPNRDLREIINFEGRKRIRTTLVQLENSGRIKRGTGNTCFEINDKPKFERLEK